MAERIASFAHILLETSLSRDADEDKDKVTLALHL
jgi:hypothetical protein